jgi:hypothetical protein
MLCWTSSKTDKRLRVVFLSTNWELEAHCSDVSIHRGAHCSRFRHLQDAGGGRWLWFGMLLKAGWFTGEVILGAPAPIKKSYPFTAFLWTILNGIGNSILQAKCPNTVSGRDQRLNSLGFLGHRKSVLSTEVCHHHCHVVPQKANGNMTATEREKRPMYIQFYKYK